MMMWFTLIGLTVGGFSIYLYINASDEIPNILLLLFVLVCAFWGLVFTPWEIQLGLLILLLASTRNLFTRTPRKLG